MLENSLNKRELRDILHNLNPAKIIEVEMISPMKSDISGERTQIIIARQEIAQEETVPTLTRTLSKTDSLRNLSSFFK